MLILVGGSLVSMRVELSTTEVMCFRLWNLRQPNIWWSVRGSKDCMASDGEAVSYQRMSGMFCRCILAMSDGETESTLVGTVRGQALGVWREALPKG